MGCLAVQARRGLESPALPDRLDRQPRRRDLPWRRVAAHRASRSSSRHATLQSTRTIPITKSVTLLLPWQCSLDSLFVFRAALMCPAPLPLCSAPWLRTSCSRRGVTWSWAGFQRPLLHSACLCQRRVPDIAAACPISLLCPGCVGAAFIAWRLRGATPGHSVTAITTATTGKTRAG